MLAVESGVMLAGLGAVVLPLVLHVAGRARQSHIFWPAIDFVDGSPRQARRWRSVRRWLLLAARMGAICFIVLAMAGLTWRPAPRQIVVVVDTSGSMATRDGGLVDGGVGTFTELTRLQAGLRMVGGVLADVRPGDRMLVMTTAQSSDPRFRPAWTTDPSFAASELAGVRQGADRSDLADALLQAARYSKAPAHAGSAGPETVIWLVTDRQDVAWKSVESVESLASLPARLGQWRQLTAGRRLSVRVVLTGDELPTDLAVEEAVPPRVQSPPQPRDAEVHLGMVEEIRQRQLRRFRVPDTDRGDRVTLVDPLGRQSVHTVGAGGGLTVGPLVGLGDYEIVSVSGQTLLRLRVPPPAEELSSRQLTDDEIGQLVGGFGGIELYPSAAWSTGQLREEIVRLLTGNVLVRGLWLMAGLCVLASWVLGGSASLALGLSGRRRPRVPWLWVTRAGVAVAVIVVASGGYLTFRPTDTPAPLEDADYDRAIAGRRVWIDQGATMAMPLGHQSSGHSADNAGTAALFEAAVRLGRVGAPVRWLEVTRQLELAGGLSGQARSLEYLAARGRYARAMATGGGGRGGGRGLAFNDLLARAEQWKKRLEELEVGSFLAGSAADARVWDPPARDARAWDARAWDARGWVRSVGRNSPAATTATTGTLIGPAALLAERTAQLHRLREEVAVAELAASPAAAAAVAEVAGMSRGAFAAALAEKLGLARVPAPQAADLLISDGLRLPPSPEGAVPPAAAALLVGGEVDDAAITSAWLVDAAIDLTNADPSDLPPAVSRTLWPGEPVSLALRVSQEGRARVSSVRINYQGETVERELTFDGDQITTIVPLPRLTSAAPARPLFATPAIDRRIRISLITSGEAVTPVVRENNAATLTARVWPVRIGIETLPKDVPPELAKIIESLDDSFVVRQRDSSGQPADVLLMGTSPPPTSQADSGRHDASDRALATSMAAWRAGGGGVVALMTEDSPPAIQVVLPGRWERTSPGGEVPLASTWPVLPWPALSLTGDYHSLPPDTLAQPLLTDGRGRAIIVRWPSAGDGAAPPLIAVGLGELAGWTGDEIGLLWQAIIRSAAGRAIAAEASGVAIEAPASITAGQSAVVLLRLRRADGSPEVATSVAPLVLRVDGRVVRQLPLAGAGAGWYTATVHDLTPDQYTLHFGGDLSPSVPLEVLRPRLSRLSADRAALAAALGINDTDVVTLGQLYRLEQAVSRAAIGKSSAAPWYRHPLAFIALVALLGAESWLAGRRGAVA